MGVAVPEMEVPTLTREETGLVFQAGEEIIFFQHLLTSEGEEVIPEIEPAIFKDTLLRAAFAIVKEHYEVHECVPNTHIILTALRQDMVYADHRNYSHQTLLLHIDGTKYKEWRTKVEEAWFFNRFNEWVFQYKTAQFLHTAIEVARQVRAGKQPARTLDDFLNSYVSPPVADPKTTELTRFSTPLIPAALYAKMPQFFQDCVAPLKEVRTRDMFFTGLLAGAGVCFPTVYNLYFGKRNYPYLYSLIVAEAANGKGIVDNCPLIFNKVIARDRGRNREKIRQYELNKENKPEEPKCRNVIINLNSSSAALLNALDQNDGYGYMFGSEIDTLLTTMRQDWGNISPILRSIFQHETIGDNRVGSRNKTVDHPKMGLTMCGTKDQLIRLLPSADNGLFTRFLYYIFDRRDHVIQRSTTMDYERIYGEQLATRYLEIVEHYENQVWEFKLSPAQEDEFYIWLTHYAKEQLIYNGEKYDSCLIRLGTIARRIMMLLSIFRSFEDTFHNSEQKNPAGCKSVAETTCPEAQQILSCEPEDFQLALALIKIYGQHTAAIFQNLSHSMVREFKVSSVGDIMAALPQEFKRADWVAVAKKLNIGRDQADAARKKLLAEGVLEQVNRSTLRKISP